MKVLAVVPSLYDTSPGQRFRLEQWEPLLTEWGVNISYSPFETPELREILYKPGGPTKKIGAVIRGLQRRSEELRSVKDFDLVYVFREAALLGPAWFERKIAASGVPMIFDFDDAVFVAYKSPSNGYLSYLKFPRKTETIIRRSAHVMAGNRYLADYAQKFNDNVTVVPTTIDTEKYTVEPKKRSVDVPVIGWSGSFSTVQHLDTIREALQELSNKHRFKLRVIGTAKYYLDGVQTEAIEWRSETEVDDLRAIDIGVMPLPDDEWSKGKCGLKALQYMALGIPTVCSPVGVNTEIIQDGQNGYIADSPTEWVEKLSRLILDKESRLRLGNAGRQTVEEKYSAIAQAPKVFDLFQSVVTKNAQTKHG